MRSIPLILSAVLFITLTWLTIEKKTNHPAVAQSGEPNIETIKTADQQTITARGIITYTIKITNTGSQEAKNITIKDVIPNDMVYIYGSATGENATYSLDPPLLQWSMNSLAINASSEVSFKTTYLICQNNDYSCPWECNDWKLDNDCGVPTIYNFIESRTPNEYLESNMIHWDDTEWRTHQPLTDKVSEITSQIADEFEQAKAIAEWVKHSKPYGFPSPANDGKSVIEIFNSNTGVCMDAAILTTAMARIAGIPSRAVLPGPHEYTEVYIDDRWIGMDSTFGNGEVLVINPVTNIVANNQFHKHEPRFTTIFSDGTPVLITDVSYYKVNQIPTTIYKDAQAEVEVIWSPNTSEPILSQSCDIYNSRTGDLQQNITSPSVLYLTPQNNEYRLLCKLVFVSNPLKEYQDHVEINFDGASVHTINYVVSSYLNIHVETKNINNTQAGWGTIYIPTTSKVVFKNQDDTYSLFYNKNKYVDFTEIKWVIKSDNLDCDFYHCRYLDSNDYSQQISPPDILAYGTSQIGNSVTRNMPPAHYNGFYKIKLPEGKYKLVYSMPFGGDVGYTLFEILPNQKVIIHPNQINKIQETTDNQYEILTTALLNSIGTINPLLD